MRIVKLKGGLGNQMFQYAFAKLVEKHTGEVVKLDYSAFENLSNDKVRVPRIRFFKISLEKAETEDINNFCILNHLKNSQSLLYKIGIFIEKTINKKYYWEPNRAFRPLNILLGYRYFDGYWQSWRYIEDIKECIFNEFEPNYDISINTRKMQELLKNENSVFIGIRRGDYSQEQKHYGCFSELYYRRAMEYIEKRVSNPVYYVFSNDIEWCKKNIDWTGHSVNFREKDYQTNDFEELLLMSSCKHAIIVNSTYNWWGAYLIKNDNKIICCPTKWWFDNKPIDIIPNDWVRISNEV